MLRALGYPHLVPLDSFRSSNFPLVAALLVWLTKRFDPDLDIPTQHDTVEERVHLVRSAAEFMVSVFQKRRFAPKSSCAGHEG